MLIWANKGDINTEIINPIEIIYRKEFGLKKLREELKAWELSVIFRQIKKHFGERKNISILDFGAGVSPFGTYLNHIGYRLVTCLDKEKGWHPEINQEKYNKKYNSCVKYIKIDITQNQIEKYDVIFSVSVLEHIKDNGMKSLRSLSTFLKPKGLFIHVADYDKKIDFKNLIDNCGISISYKPEETPGCEEFKASPKYAWFKRGKSRIAFFNEEIHHD